MNNSELIAIGELTAKLVKLKLEVTPHLDVGNFGAETFGKLLREYTKNNSEHKDVSVDIDEYLRNLK